MSVKRWLAMLALGVNSVGAYAACTLSDTAPAGFGIVTSNAVRTVQQVTSTTNGALTCSGSLVSLLSSSDHFILTITSSTTGLVGPSGDIIPYTLYGDSGTGYPLARNTPFDFGTTTILNLLGLLGSSTPKPLPLYLRTTLGSNVAAGIYQETLNLGWSWDYCTGVGALGACIGGRDKGSGSKPLVVTLTVSNDCQINAPDISFGAAPVVSAFATVNQAVNLSCTKGSTYSVGLSDGGNVAGGRRRMVANGSYLAYDIFKSATAVRWGSVSSARRSSSDADVNPGPGTGTGSQVFNYNARIYTDQATPPGGAYTDSVILDVTF